MLPRTALIDAQVSSAKAQVEAMNAGKNRTSVRTSVFACEQGSPGSKEGSPVKDQALLARTVHAHLLRHLNRTAQQLRLLELDMSNPVEPFRRAAT